MLCHGQQLPSTWQIYSLSHYPCVFFQGWVRAIGFQIEIGWIDVDPVAHTMLNEMPHTHTHTHTHTSTHTHTHTCTHARTQAHTHTHARMHTHTHIHTHMIRNVHTLNLITNILSGILYHVRNTLNMSIAWLLSFLLFLYYRCQQGVLSFYVTTRSNTFIKMFSDTHYYPQNEGGGSLSRRVSVQGSLSMEVSIPVESLSRWGLCRETPPLLPQIRKACGTHPTGMLSCFF